VLNDPFIVPQFGLHPWWSGEERPEDWLDRLRQLLLAHPSSGVGEIGIDKIRKKIAPMPIQISTMKAQLDLAQEMRRTATVHCVGAYGTLVDILKTYAPLQSPIVIHSFSGNADQIRDLSRISPEIYFSVSGKCPQTEVIEYIPLDRLLIETDAPCMAFESDVLEIDGLRVLTKLDEKTNDSSQVILVADRVSRATGKRVSEIQQITLANTITAFQL
jgi:TatD DNase family protein